MNNHWGNEYVYWATYEARLFEGYSDGTFRPEEGISRIEYIAILSRLLENQNLSQYMGKDNTVTIDYIDLEKTHWGYNHINNLANIIDRLDFTQIRLSTVFPGERLYPNRKITRYEAALLTRAVSTPPLELKEYNYVDIPNSITFYNEILELINNNILIGYMNRFRLYDYITRAQSATIMKRVFDDLKYLKTDYFRLLPIENEVKDYPLFFEEGSNRTSVEDRRFIDAVTSLEYKAFVGYIPFDEQHLYDMSPRKTLWELKERGYNNVLGLNYYILNYDKEVNEVRRTYLIEESLSNYLELEHKDIEGIYNLLSYSVVNNKYIDKELLTLAVEKYYKSSEDLLTTLQGGALLSEVYFINGKLEKAMDVLKELMETKPELNLMSNLMVSYAFLLYEKDKLEALQYIDSAFSSLMKEEISFTDKEEITFKFTAFKKQLLLKP